MRPTDLGDTQGGMQSTKNAGPIVAHSKAPGIGLTLILRFIALLEPTREGLVEITQAAPHAPMYVRLSFTAS